MLALFTDPRMLGHVPPARHPERPGRLSAVTRHLERTGLTKTCSVGTIRPATDEELLRVHSVGYLDALVRAEREGGGQVEADTWMSSGTLLAARLAAGAAVEAVRLVIEGPTRRAFCATRPPGHHARPDQPMGFCFFSNAAVAAAEARDRLGLDRILIVDFDVHHGNGTQEALYEDGRVGLLSVHRYPFYPGTGAADETGAGRGLGWTCNVPLPGSTLPSDYHAAFRLALERLADRTRPELVIVSAGFDAHAEDPIGGLGLEAEDFDWISRAIVEVADVHAGGRIVSLLEGGYNVPILAGCVAAHVQILAAERSTSSDPDGI